MARRPVGPVPGRAGPIPESGHGRRHHGVSSDLIKATSLVGYILVKTDSGHAWHNAVLEVSFASPFLGVGLTRGMSRGLPIAPIKVDAVGTDGDRKRWLRDRWMAFSLLSVRSTVIVRPAQSRGSGRPMPVLALDPVVVDEGTELARSSRLGPIFDIVDYHG